MLLSGKKGYIRIMLEKIKSHFENDYLFRNSAYLMSATGVMAAFGVLFWLVASRLYKSDEVGIGTTLISVTSLITSFSLLGLGSALINYLPKSSSKNEKIGTALTSVGLASVLFAFIYVVFINIFSPKLIFIKENIAIAVLFIVFTAFNTLNILTDDVFTASRNTKYVLIRSTVFSVIKFISLFGMVVFGACGIYYSYGVAATIGFILGVFILTTKLKYRLHIGIRKEIVDILAKFSLGNYIGTFIGSLPALSLPILITNNIGVKYSAYFFMDMMMANLLYIIPYAVSQSLFTEGSYNEEKFEIHLKKAITIITLLMIPIIIGTILLGRYVLLIFGREYSDQGVLLLQMLVFSGLFVSVNGIAEAVLKVKHRIRQMIFVKLVGTLIILGVGAFLHSYGLSGIGIGWLVGTMAMSGIYIFYGVFR